MLVLIACESSGVVRDAFIRQGHAAISCDLLPTEVEGPHIQGNVLEHLDKGWDLLIGHPPCTYLANAGVRWLHEHVVSRRGNKPPISGGIRWHYMYEGAAFFMSLKNAPIPRIAIENPVPHGYAKKLIGDYSQLIQPWQFGAHETKATCLWLKGLPLLQPTDIVEVYMHRVHEEPPGEDRWKRRSRTFPGIALAMAQQWGA